MKNKLGAVIFFLLILSNSCFALNEEINVDIVANKAVVEQITEFDQALTGQYELNIPSDANAINVYADDNLIYGKKQDTKLIVQLNKTKILRISYITKFFLDNENFLMSYKADQNTALKLKVVLPERAVLEQKTGAAIPEPTQKTSDGRSIILIWEKEILKNDEFAVFVRYSKPTNIIPYFVIVVVIYLLIAWYLTAKKPKPAEKIVEKHIVDTSNIEEHLKEDEEQIINILKKREGKCEQGTLRVITGIPKASLSRILKELEDHRIIYKEKRGKKNLVFLRK